MDTKISAKILADSTSSQGARITTFLLTYPRIIHSELMTHRVFSRNSASSRAIPFNKMVKIVEEDPFIPIAWQKDHKGMQGNEYYDYIKAFELTDDWLEARNNAVNLAKKLNKKGVTKQLCNRLLEPFMWHTVLLTGTEFENFFKLRCPQYHYDLEDIYFKSRKDWLAYYKLNCIGNPDSDFDLNEMDWYNINKSQAEIHIQALAEAMWDAMNESIPKTLRSGDWHIPFGDKIQLTYTDYDSDGVINQEGTYKKIRIATAKSARLSYMTFDGEIDYEKDIQLHDKLLADGHMSPFEHCARTMSEEEYGYLYKSVGPNPEHFEIGWCNNYRGFIQYRHLIENCYDGFRI